MSDDLNRRAAELMGWVIVATHRTLIDGEWEGAGWSVFDENGMVKFVDLEEWSPTTNPAHSRMLLDEIERSGKITEFINSLDFLGAQLDFIENNRPNPKDMFAFIFWTYITATPQQVTAAFVAAMEGRK